MQFINKIKLLALMTSPLMLAGCFSGDGGTGGGVQVKESQLAIDTSTAPKGPAAYAVHQNLENDQQLLNQLNSIIKRNNESKKAATSASSMQASSSIAFYIDTSEAPEGPAPYAVHKNFEGQQSQNFQLTSVVQNNKPYSTTANNSDFTDLSDITVPSSCSVQPPNEVNTEFDDTGSLIGIMSDFVPVMKPLATAFGAVKTLKDLFDPAATVNIATCMKNTLAEVNTRFNKVIADINQLHSEMLNEDNFILSEIAANSFTDLAIAYNNYEQNRIQIIGDNNSPGIYQEFLTTTGVAATPMTKLQQVAEKPANMMLATFTLAISGYNIDLSFFNLAGATYDRDVCASTSTSCVNTITVQSNFSDHTNSSLLLLLDLAKAHLLVKIAETVQENANLDITEQKNILDLYDQYNDFVSSLYLQSLTAMTADYYLMRTANSMNYYAAYKNQFNSYSSSVYIPDFTEIPGTSYQPAPAESNTKASIVAAATNGITDLKNAQQSLDTFYAGVVNQLYQNIASYIVTDFPVNGQLNTAEQADWSSSTLKIQGFTGYSAPAGTGGFYCYKSTAPAGNGYPTWSKTNLSYNDCESAKNDAYSQNNLVALVAYSFHYTGAWATNCIKEDQYLGFIQDYSSQYQQSGCYIWSEDLSSQSDSGPYPSPYQTKGSVIDGEQVTIADWSSLPPGAIPQYTTYATIENAIALSTFVASNAFQPMLNPEPDSNQISGMPYLNLSSVSNSILYQAPHLRDVNACVGSYIASAATGGTLNDYYANFESNCPAFFGENGNKGMLSTTPAFSDINSNNILVAPVLINGDGTSTSYGMMYGVFESCQSASELVTYLPTTLFTTAVKSVPYLTCRLWKNKDEFYDEQSLGNSFNWPGANQTGSPYQYNVSEESMHAVGGSWQAWTPVITKIIPSGNSWKKLGEYGYDSCGDNCTGDSNYTPYNGNYTYNTGEVSSNAPSIPQDYGNMYITGISNSKNSNTASPYFTGNAGNLSIDLSTPGALNNMEHGYWFYFGNMQENAPITPTASVHMMSVSLEIDGFYYPLVFQFWNVTGQAGNGFKVVQNTILQDVGFIIDNQTVPLISINSAISGTSLPYITEGGSRTSNDYSYGQIPELQFIQQPIINNMAFWLNGDADWVNVDINEGWGGGNSIYDVKYWKSDTMFLQYGSSVEVLENIYKQPGSGVTYIIN